MRVRALAVDIVCVGCVVYSVSGVFCGNINFVMWPQRFEMMTIVRGGVSILCMCACGVPANNECTYNKLRTEQSTDFKLYIGSDESFLLYLHNICIQVPTYKVKYCIDSS